MLIEENKSVAHTIGSIKKWINPDDVFLDLGCGNGAISHCLERDFGYSNVYGTDVKDLREFDTNRFTEFDGQKLPYDSSYFDAVLLAFVLHHIPNEKKITLLKEVMRVTKGVIIILEDTPRNILDVIMSNLHGRRFRKKVGSQEDFGFYSQEGWENIFLELGLKIHVSERLNRFCRTWHQPFARSKFVLMKNA